jgi:hypothetical protein
MVAVLSALAWLAVDVTSIHLVTYPLIPFWNVLVRFGFFSLIITIVCQLKMAHEEQRRTTQTLQTSLDTVKILRGLIPICAWCKKVRDERGYWQQVEAYIAERSEASFTHGMCQECHDKER